MTWTSDLRNGRLQYPKYEENIIVAHMSSGGGSVFTRILTNMRCHTTREQKAQPNGWNSTFTVKLKQRFTSNVRNSMKVVRSLTMFRIIVKKFEKQTSKFCRGSFGNRARQLHGNKLLGLWKNGNAAYIIYLLVHTYVYNATFSFDIICYSNSCDFQYRCLFEYN